MCEIKQRGEKTCKPKILNLMLEMYQSGKFSNYKEIRFTLVTK